MQVSLAKIDTYVSVFYCTIFPKCAQMYYYTITIQRFYLQAVDIFTEICRMKNQLFRIKSPIFLLIHTIHGAQHAKSYKCERFSVLRSKLMGLF